MKTRILNFICVLFLGPFCFYFLFSPILIVLLFLKGNIAWDIYKYIVFIFNIVALVGVCFMEESELTLFNKQKALPSEQTSLVEQTSSPLEQTALAEPIVIQNNYIVNVNIEHVDNINVNIN